MKRGVESRIGLAVISMIMIMLIFGIVLILSGRTVMPVANAIINSYDIDTQVPCRSALLHENVPCYLLKCRGWKQPTLLGYETVREGETYAMCVCAKIIHGKAIYNEQSIKKIQVPSE